MLHCFRPTTLALALLLGAGAAQAADAPADAAPLANGSSAPLPLDELRTFAEVLDRVKAAYVEPVDDKTLLENAIKGMLSNPTRTPPTSARRTSPSCRKAPAASSAAWASRLAAKTASSRWSRRSTTPPRPAPASSPAT